MAILLILITFAMLALAELGRAPTDGEPGWSWERAVLVAACILGSALVLIAEGLSFFHALRQGPLIAAWLLAAGLSAAYAVRRRRLAAGARAARRLPRGLTAVDAALAAALLLLAILVVAVAFVSPPNNVDALQYHMPRVLHWIQNASLEHFATPYDSQDARPFWAELAILHLRLLWGGDRPANLPQAFSLIGIVVAAISIAGQLGADRRGRILAGGLAFAVPMGLLQASTPKNDVVSSFWVMATACFVVREATVGLSLRERWALFASVALAVLAKGTAIPFVAPLLVWYCVVGLRRRSPLSLVARNLPAVLVLVLLNGGFWYRNTVTYGGPFGSELPVGVGMPAGSRPAVAVVVDQADPYPGAGGLAAPARPGAVSRSEVFLASGFEGYLARWARLLAMHFVTPVRAVNEVIFGLMRRAPAVFPDGFIHSLELSAWNHEMTAGNPLHLLLITAAAVVLGVTRSLRRAPSLVALFLAAFGGLFLISFAGCIDSVFCMRYQLSFFHLAAPAVAIVVYRLWPRSLTAAGLLILLYASPYVLFNNMRPVVGMPPWPTRIRSVFIEDVDTILFAQSPEIRDEYQFVTSRVLDEGCRQVGLATTRDNLEYTLWRLLGAPDSKVVIEHLRASPETEKYLDPQFSPCAVICTVCSEIPVMQGLPLASDFGHVRLYLRPAP